LEGVGWGVGPGVRCHLVTTLGCLGPEAVPFIVPFLSDRHACVCEAAAQALCGMGEAARPHAAPILAAILKNRSNVSMAIRHLLHMIALPSQLSNLAENILSRCQQSVLLPKGVEVEEEYGGQVAEEAATPFRNVLTSAELIEMMEDCRAAEQRGSELGVLLGAFGKEEHEAVAQLTQQLMFERGCSQSDAAEAAKRCSPSFAAALAWLASNEHYELRPATPDTSRSLASSSSSARSKEAMSDELVAQFISLTGASPEEAKSYLEMTGGDLCQVGRPPRLDAPCRIVKCLRQALTSVL